MGTDNKLPLWYNTQCILSKLILSVVMKVQMVKAFWRGNLSQPIKMSALTLALDCSSLLNCQLMGLKQTVGILVTQQMK